MRRSQSWHARWHLRDLVVPETVLAFGLFLISPILVPISLEPLGYVINVLWLSSVVLARKHPMLGVILTAIAYIPYLVTPMPSSIMFCTGAIIVGVYYTCAFPGRVLLSVAVSGALVGVPWRLTGYIDHYDMVASLALVVAAIAIGSASHRRQLRLEAEREEHAEALQAVRVIMASELHDSVAQTQSLVVMRLEDALWDHQVPDGLREDLEDVLALSRRAATELRTALGTLHSMDERFTTLGLPATITLGQTWDKSIAALQAAGFDVQARYALGAKRFDPAREHALARTVEELTSNVLWHGALGPCIVSVTLQDGDAIVYVENDIGPAEARRAKAGSGLLGVKERVRLLAGECDFRAYGQRWGAHVRIPTGTQLKPGPPNLQLPVLAS